jgi:aldose 1-epimerase
MGDGSVREVLLGCPNEAAYRAHTAYLGATIGRFANRLRDARFRIDGTDYALDANDGNHCLHGGAAGFGRRDWAIEELAASRVRFSTASPDGEGGFPGQMTAETIYSVAGDDLAVTIEFLAAVDRPCPVSLTNHAYFNLDGDAGDSRRHTLRLASARYLPIDADGLPLGKIADVCASPFDFTTPTALDSTPESHPQLQLNRGYNHAFLLDSRCRDLVQPAAELVSGDGRLALRVFTSLPALHLYGGNYLAGTPSRNGGAYADYAGIALEAEYLPDSPNHPEWPEADCILRPGRVYRQRIRYQFVVR